MSSADLLAVAARLAKEGVAFALITVVRAVPPTSGKPGDKAILTARGEWLGWVGGSCAEPTARRAALAALADGRCRLIHLTNDEAVQARSGVELAAMSCYSGGSLEIYVEPHLVEPALLVFGRSPIAQAVAELGAALKYRVTRVDLRPEAALVDGANADLAAALDATSMAHRMSELPQAPGANTFIVVASHGYAEDQALAWALSGEAAYVGLVSSQRRVPEVLRQLAERGVPAERLGRLRAPAGLPIGASGPEEVALSVLSEMVAARRGAALGVRGEGARPAEAVSPVPAPALAAPVPSCCAEDVAPVRAPGVTAAAPSCCEAAAEPTPPRGPAPARAPSFSAVVLAAGLSRRMGAPNKLLLPIAGQPMIRHVVQTLVASDFAQIVVVLGHQALEVGAAIRSLGVRVVHNEQFESGQVSSVRAGLAALTPATDAVMVCLGDQPLLTRLDIQLLKRAFVERDRGSILVPMYGERRGNPVVLDWQSAEETLKRGTNFGCRHFMEENAERVCLWQASSDHFIRDVDQPADYQALLVQTTP